MRTLLVGAALLLAACGGTKGAFHDPCTANTDCSGTFTCVPSNVMSGSSCSQKGSTCGTVCTAKADCAAISANAECATDCTGAKSCVKL